jgi:uncharacterized membrane protein
MNYLQLARVSALLGYFGLLILLMVWIIWLTPSHTSHLPTSLALLLLVGPLMFPLRGLLHGRSYTHAWASFLALFYLLLGISEAWSNSEQRLLAGLEIIFSSLLYLGAMFYARLRGKEVKKAEGFDAKE